MGQKKVIYECDACRKEFESSGNTGIHNLVIKGHFRNSSPEGLKIYSFEAELCPECSQRVCELLFKELKLGCVCTYGG